MKNILLIVVFVMSISFGLQAQEKDAMAAGMETEMYFTKTVEGSMEEVYDKVGTALKTEKFGIVTEVDMAQTLKKKMDVDMEPYKILGVCSPPHAHHALQAEPNIGVFLPCKIVLKQVGENKVEVVSINPMLMMQMLNNPDLDKVAREVSEGLYKVISGL